MIPPGTVPPCKAASWHRSHTKHNKLVISVLSACACLLGLFYAGAALTYDWHRNRTGKQQTSVQARRRKGCRIALPASCVAYRYRRMFALPTPHHDRVWLVDNPRAKPSKPQDGKLKASADRAECLPDLRRDACYRAPGLTCDIKIVFVSSVFLLALLH